jgi:hypothetical protein
MAYHCGIYKAIGHCMPREKSRYTKTKFQINHNIQFFKHAMLPEEKEKPNAGDAKRRINSDFALV